MNRFVSRWTPAATLEALVWGLALIAAVGIPTAHFAGELQFQRGTLASVAGSRAIIITQRIAANPQMWRYEEHRLMELVQQSIAADDRDDRRSILDADGNVLVENRAVAELRRPIAEHRVALHDAGRVVGWFAVERSTRPLILHALAVAMASVIVSALILVFLKRLPLRALRSAEAELQHKAFHDDLTGLYNRGAFRRLLERAVARAERRQASLAVLFVDLDRFKTINDTLGHDAGDEVLRGVAERLRSSVRAHDVVARLSGDEFAVVVDGLTSDGAAGRAADALLSRFESPFIVGGRQWHLTCSVGLSMFPHHARDPDKLLAFADTAMLQAKSSGRSAQRVYSEHMQEGAVRRLHLEDDLRGALDRHEFVLHYQPLVDLSSGGLRAAEALVRWQHPQRGLVSPIEFIPVLEDLGLIHAVGQWVLSEACTQMRHWVDVGHPLQRVSVNVSALQFARGTEFVEQVRRALTEARLAPERLELELTEGILMSDSEHSLATLRDLQRLGVWLAIDDFGTGYSSLAYLRSFPVTTLKVDRSFVKEMCSSPRDASIVKAVVQLAHGLGLSVTAEGIETADQLAALRALGCDTGQGYAFGRPVPAAAFTLPCRETLAA